MQLLEKESRMVAEAAKRGENVGGVEIALNQGKPIEQILGGSRYAHLDAAPAAACNRAGLPITVSLSAASVNSDPAGACYGHRCGCIAHSRDTTGGLPLAQEQAFVKSVPIVPTQIYVQAAAFSSRKMHRALLHS